MSASINEAAILESVHQRLDQPWCRLVTILGPPGQGKARLAAAAARGRQARYADGARVIALTRFDAGDADPAQALAARIAAELGLTIIAPPRPLTRLLAFLQPRQMLLVLVDFQQALAGVEAVLAIVQCCAGVQVLITSEEALELRAEWLVSWDEGNGDLSAPS